MKQISIFILPATLTLLSCKAQNPIIPLYLGGEYAETQNAYYKDVDNDFNRFVGTWLYTNGDEVFEIVLDKRELDFYNKPIDIPPHYTDYLYGEFRYVDENGTELVNTLSNMGNTGIAVSEHRIFGNRIIPYKFLPRCEDCSPGERRVRLSLEDPDRDYLSYEIVLRTVPNALNPAVNDMQLVLGLGYSIIPDGAETETRIPYGEYLLVKQ